MASRFSIETVFKAIDQITRPVAKMQSRIDRMTASTERGIQRLSRSTDHLSSRLTDAGTSGAVGLAGPVAVAGTALTLINKATTETDLLARSVQVSTGTIDGLTHALRGAGFETEDVISLVEEMNNKLGESAGLQEITPVTESLGILGLSFERIKDLSPEEQFLAITDAALKMEDAQKAAAAADILLGGEANRVIGVLREQGGTTADLIARYQELNFLTEEGRFGAAAWSDSMNTTTTIVSSLGKQIAGLAGKQMSPLLDLLNETAVANKALINEQLTAFFAGLADRVEWVIVNFESVVTWVRRIGSVIGVFFLMAAALKAVSIAMGFVGLIISLVKAVAFIAGAMKLATVATLGFNVALLANPIGLVIAGVVALGAAAITLLDAWQPVGEFFTGLWDRVTGIFGSDPPEVIEEKQVVSQQERAAAATTAEQRTVADITVRAEDGSAASMTERKSSPGVNLKMDRSGAFG